MDVGPVLPGLGLDDHAGPPSAAAEPPDEGSAAAERPEGGSGRQSGHVGVSQPAADLPNNVVRFPPPPLRLDPPEAAPVRGEDRLAARNRKFLARYRAEALELWDAQEAAYRDVAGKLGRKRVRGRAPIARLLVRAAERLDETDRDTCRRVINAFARRALKERSLDKLDPKLIWSEGGFDRALRELETGETRRPQQGAHQGFHEGPAYEPSGKEFVLE